jgi:arylsulfatase A-like enzyme
VFIASGPSIAPRSDARDVSFYDITPTIIDLAGFEPVSDLTGHSAVKPVEE